MMMLINVNVKEDMPELVELGEIYQGLKIQA